MAPPGVKIKVNGVMTPPCVEFGVNRGGVSSWDQNLGELGGGSS